MHYINAGITVLLFFIGWFIRVKKVTWLISGYNTLSKEKKDEYDIDKLTRYMGNFLFILSAIWGIMTVHGIIFPNVIGTIMVAGTVVFTIVIIVGVIWLNTGNRVKKEKSD